MCAVSRRGRRGNSLINHPYWPRSPPGVLDEARHIFISGADIGERQAFRLLRCISHRAASRVIFRFASGVSVLAFLHLSLALGRLFHEHWYIQMAKTITLYLFVHFKRATLAYSWWVTGNLIEFQNEVGSLIGGDVKGPSQLIG